MAVTGTSFYYEESKTDILKEESKNSGRTLSGYIQIVLQQAIDNGAFFGVPETQGSAPVMSTPKKKTKKTKKVVLKRRVK